MNLIKKAYCLLLVLLYSTILHAQDSRWNVNIYDYQYDMSVYAELQYNGSVITDFANIEVAAFVGNECRAVGVPQQKDGVRWIYFRVRSNTVAGENVVFKMYDKSEDKEYYLSSDEGIEFEANRSLGLPSSPITLVKTVLYSVSASSVNESMGSATIENYIGQAPENSNVIVKATPAVGHSFVEWSNNGTIVSTDNPYTFKITEDTHLLAHFKINQYTITFDTDGGSEIAPITQDYNTAITAPADPTKTGYTFAGWDKEIPEMMTAENITIKALWTINSYKLTYKVDGEDYKQYDVEYNASITPEAAPEKEGYTFSGWSEIPTTMPANDVEVTGTFTVNQYKVTFIVDGEVVKEETLDFGTTITAPENPTKVGHTFTGWNPAVDTTVPSHDVTYTAQFSVNQYTITFDTDGGSEITPVTQDYNTAVTAPSDPTKTGYTFTGWDKEIPTTIPAEDITIKALWTINSYKLTYKVDGEVYKQYDVEYNASITPEAAPEKEGYTFSGWSEIPATMPANDVEVNGTFTINQYKVTFIVDGEVVKEETLDFGTNITAPENPTKIGHTFTGWNPAVDTTVPSHDVTYTAQFAVNQYTITFDTDGGSEITPITQDYNTAVTAPSDPTKTGYTFAGWDKEIPEMMTAENITIKALWTINSYKLTYKVDGEDYKQYDVEYNASITPEAAPEKEGYTFSGWSEIPTTMPANDVEVTGTFTVNQYKVTFIVDGEVVKEETLDFGTTITAPENPTKVGHTFTGWNPAVDTTVPSHDVTYTAQFSVNQYTITFDTDGGSEITPVTQDYNTAVTAPSDPTKTGYTFTGWDKEIPTTIPAEDITIKALWTINSYKLTYKVDGEVYKQYDVEYNASITPEAAPEKEGYTFSGWSEIPATMPANDVEVNGTFTINQYKVTFIVDGEVVKEETLDFGTNIIAPENPTKVGHTFTGWNPAVDATVPSHDVTYTAQFTANQYTITFDTDGGSEIAPITQDYNTAVTAPSDPIKTGYTFTGWDKEIPAMMPVENLTIKATWSINQYTITFDTDGGSEIAPITQDYNSTITAPTNPTKTGYTFAGWDKEIPATMPAENITVKALWTINKYMLTYKVDGEVYKQYEVEYNATITPETAPVKEGHTFSGWSEIPSTMPANDVEVTGSFTINQYKVTFIVNGEIIKQETLDFGSAITAPVDPTKIGHTFTGWNPAVDAIVPAHDVTYEAMFEINTYKLTYYVDGVVYKDFEVEYGSEIILEENPVKEGYDFSGWSEIPQFMPDHDVDVYGTFTVSTGINNVKSISGEERIYDLSGNVIQHARKGINIINGKKVLIK